MLLKYRVILPTHSHPTPFPPLIKSFAKYSGSVRAPASIEGWGVCLPPHRPPRGDPPGQKKNAWGVGGVQEGMARFTPFSTPQPVVVVERNITPVVRQR